MRSFDVVIIGAGLAGLQCARLLSSHGAKILLVDRKEDLSAGIHTTGIFVRKTLEDFDFPPGTLGASLSHVSLYSPKLRRLELASEKTEFRVGRMGVLYEYYLEDCITNGVQFARGTRYISARPSDNAPDEDVQIAPLLGKQGWPAGPGWLISFSSPSAPNLSGRRLRQAVLAGDGEAGSIVTLEKNGERYQVRARVLVGADGAGSRVARDLGLDENKECIVGYEEVYSGVPLEGAPRLHCFLDSCLAPGYLAWISNDGDETHIGVGGYANAFNPREALNVFREKVSGKFVDLRGAVLAETRGGRIPVGGILRRIANRRGLLIGDAAGAVSPLTAGGLDPALRLSMFAAEIIRERLRTGDARALLEFSGARFRGRFISRLWMRRLITVMQSNTLLELGFGVLRGRVGRKLAEHVFFGRGSFPDVGTGKPVADLRGEAISWR
jgi:flavin-dependent dehydrogenase